MDDELTALTDELFSVDPEEFTAKRDAIVKQLKAEKRKEHAAEVSALRRPTAALWAMNQVARSRPNLVAALADAGVVAIGAQDAVMSGSPMSVLHDALDARRALVSHLLDSITGLLVEKGAATDTVIVPMRHALEVASVDTEIMAAFMAGRLTAIPTTADERNAPKPKPKETKKSHLSVVGKSVVGGSVVGGSVVGEPEQPPTPAEPTAPAAADEPKEQQPIALDHEEHEGRAQQAEQQLAQQTRDRERAEQEQVEQLRAEQERERERVELEQQQAKAEEQQRVADAAQQLREHFARAVAQAKALADNAHSDERALIENHDALVAASTELTTQRNAIDEQIEALAKKRNDLVIRLGDVDAQLERSAADLVETAKQREACDAALAAAESNAAAATLAMG